MNKTRSVKIWMKVSAFAIAILLIFAIQLFLSSLPSASQTPDDSALFYQENQYVLGHINGLNTDRERASRELDNLSDLINELRIEMPDSGSKPVSSLFNSRALIYNNSLKDGHEFGAVRQYIASIALKIQEGLVLDPKLAANLTPEEREKTVVDQSWALTRLIFTNQSSGNVLRDIAQQAGLIGGGLLNPIRYQNFPSEAILEYAKQVIDDLINLNQLSFQSLERTLIDLLSSNQQNKLLLTSYSQGTIWTPILLDSPNIKTYEPPSKKGCIISTFQIANMTTPYSFYEGDPLYVTSNRDNIVNAVRQGILTISGANFLDGYVPPPADSNFTGDASRATNGHGLSQVYLNGRRGGRPTNNSGRAISGRKIINAIKLMNRPECYDLEIEEMEFIPPATSTGQANLKLKVRLLDARGRVVEDVSGKRPPVQITFPSITNGELDPAEGETDEKGEFTTQTTILNLDRPIQGERVYMQVDARAEYQIKDAQGRPIGDPLVATDSKQLNYTGGSGSGSSGSGGSGGSGGGYCPPGANCDPDPSQADPDAGKADGVGDPHLYTLDRLRYDFHGVGEYILSQSVVPELDFQLQARFGPFGNSSVASMTRAIATQMGSLIALA